MAASVRFSDLGTAFDAAEGDSCHALAPEMGTIARCGVMLSSVREMANRPLVSEVECGRHV